MLKETLAKIEISIKKMRSGKGDKKEELLRLLATLKAEIEQLSETHSEHAQSIAGFASIAAHEAARKQKASGLQRLSLNDLASSAEGFETSHPKLVETINHFCSLLASIGI